MIGETIGRPIRIVYVEDNKSISFSIPQILIMSGYEVMCAGNGKQGIETVEDWKPDIILMDLRMPVMDGPTDESGELPGQPDSGHWGIV